MSLFAIFTIFVLLFYFIKYRNMKILFFNILSFYIFTYMNIEAGYFIKVGDLYIKPSYVVGILLFFLSSFIILSRMQSIKKKKIVIYSITFLISIIIGIVGLIFRPLNKFIATGSILLDEYWQGKAYLQQPVFDGLVIRFMLQLIIFTVILIAIVILFDKNYCIRLLERVSILCRIPLVYAVFEFVSKNIFKSNIAQSIIQVILGSNENVFSEMEQRGNFYRLIGFTTEASHFSYTLFIIAIINFSLMFRNKRYRKWFILANILLLSTMAFSSILNILGLMSIYFLYKNVQTFYVNKKILTNIIFVSILLIVIYIFVNSSLFKGTYYGQRIYAILDDNLLFVDIYNIKNIQYTSSRVRLISIVSTLELLKYRPFFGLGLGAASSHGSLAMILSNIGLVGTILWIRMLFYNDIKNLFEINRYVYAGLIFVWCIIGLFTSHFLGMLYNAENYLLMISFLIISEKRKNKYEYCN